MISIFFFLHEESLGEISSSLYPFYSISEMRWLRLVGSLNLQVSFAKELYKRDNILYKRPIILRSLLTVATPYLSSIYPFYQTLLGNPQFSKIFNPYFQSTNPYIYIYKYKHIWTFSAIPSKDLYNYKLNTPGDHFPQKNPIFSAFATIDLHFEASYACAPPCTGWRTSWRRCHDLIGHFCKSALWLVN